MPVDTVNRIKRDERIRQFCQKYEVKELSLFGSVVREDFGPESDIDVLIELEPEHSLSLFDLVRMENELAAMFGRSVDLVTRAGLNRHIRDRILNSRVMCYVG